MSCFIVLLNLMVIICEKLKQSEIRVALTKQLIVIAISFLCFSGVKKGKQNSHDVFYEWEFYFPLLISWPIPQDSFTTFYINMLYIAGESQYVR